MTKPIPFEFKKGDIVKRKVDDLWDWWGRYQGTNDNYTVTKIEGDKLRVKEMLSTWDVWRFELVSRPMPVEPRKPRTGEGWVYRPNGAQFKVKWTEVITGHATEAIDCKEVKDEKARYPDCPCKAHSTPC